MPGTLRNRLFLLIFLVSGIPIILSGFFIARTSVNAMVEEKQQKLFGAARVLDRYLPESYEDILRHEGAANADQATRVKVLNAKLAQFTDAVAQAYPGLS